MMWDNGEGRRREEESRGRIDQERAWGIGERTLCMGSGSDTVSFFFRFGGRRHSNPLVLTVLVFCCSFCSPVSGPHFFVGADMGEGER